MLERFTARHRCQRPQLLLLEGHTDSNQEVYKNITNQQHDELGESPGQERELEITLHALAGRSGSVPQTMRMMAKIGPHEGAVLIDSGSTHNFIRDRLANVLKMPVVPTEAFTVRVANRERLNCQGRFDKVRVELQGVEFYLTLFSLPLSGLDLVLGIQ